MSSTDLPHIRKLNDGSHHFILHHKPFMIRAAELNNSSMTSSQYMLHGPPIAHLSTQHTKQSGVWSNLIHNHVNTVLGCVTWEQIEREEGEFDFRQLDDILLEARRHQLKLILLWFGSFKNGRSTYVPGWVKTDPARFPRARINRNPNEDPVIADILSIFHHDAQQADSKAFTRFMNHLKEIDGETHTVIMVQVENECGILGDSRDRSELANQRFTSPVPSELIAILQKDWDHLNDVFKRNFPSLRDTKFKHNTDWEGVFGRSQQTDELFMAYHYALYIEQVASAGKSVYPIPLYTNAWLYNLPQGNGDSQAGGPASGGIHPGEYPSGGPVETVLDIWQLFAPTLDFLAPDIYDADYIRTCQAYKHRGQPLFIPEQRRDEYGALRTWYAIGIGALATSPFGIDSYTPEKSHFTFHYRLLELTSSLILDARKDGLPMFGFFFDRFEKGEQDRSPPQNTTLGDWELLIERSFVFGHPSPEFGLIIQTSADTFLLIGQAYQITFKSNKPQTSFTGILSFDEKQVVKVGSSELRTVRMMNGDESRSGVSVVMPGEDPDYGTGIVCTTIPAATRIAECRVYSF